MHEDARAVRADLAGRIEIGEQRARDRIVEIGILEDDQRRLAAELQRHMLQRRGGIGHHRLAGADLAGERDLGDRRMPREQPAGIGKALHDIEDAVGNAGLAHDLGELRGA